MKKILLLLPAVLLTAFALTGCSEDTPTAPATTDETLTATATEEATDLDLEKSRHHDRMATYEVVIENLTPATGPGASQPFSPPILASHSGDMHVFRPWRRASSEVAGVAEDAMNGPLVDLLTASSRVNDVAVGGDVILPGGAMTLMLEARPGQARLSAIFMLVNTNDGFGGLDGMRLPLRGERSWYVPVWDAGSEVNTESAMDIPGPCCGSPGMGEDEHGRIRLHRGIQGHGDLDVETYGWNRPAARLTVRRID